MESIEALGETGKPAKSKRAAYVHTLGRLAADTGSLCGAQCVLLVSGDETLARWSEDCDPSFLLTSSTFECGARSVDLRLFATEARRLTHDQEIALHAMTIAIQRQLECIEEFQDHVAMALDQISDAFLLIRKDWTIDHVNTQFETFLGVSRAQLVGKNVWEAFPETVGTVQESEVRMAMNSGNPRVAEDYSERTQRWYQSRMFPCDTGLAILTVDITEKKADERSRAAIEQKMAQAQRLESLGTLAGGIAHDFNNFVGAILGHSELLKGTLPLDHPGMESIDQIAVAGARAREMIAQLLTYSRSAKREFSWQHLQPLVLEGMSLLRATVPPSVDLLAVVDGPALFSTITASEVFQVVMNLCTNAFHALPAEGGSVTVEVRRVDVLSTRKVQVGKLLPGTYAEVAVSDTGAGMNEETLGRLFEPFFTTKERGKGTGLGLSIVSGLVTAHGGAVVVTSEPGSGSVFCVYLPITLEKNAQHLLADAPALVLGSGEHVAYVDDDDVMLLLIQRLLERAGFSVSTFSDPEQLIARVAEAPRCFDLVISDYNMPSMTGLDLARSLRKYNDSLPLLIASGRISDELRMEADGIDGLDLVSKAFAYEELGYRAAQAIGCGHASVENSTSL